MSGTTDRLRRFIRQLHRRLVILRVIESAGIAALVGSAAGLIAVSVLLWQSRPALPAAILFIALSAAAGVIWGWHRRPRPIHAAEAADRQLALDDLLSTAWALMHCAPPIGPFERTVLAIAEAKCRSTPPRVVILNRLGRRSWGGIGLALSLVLGLGLMSLNPLESDLASAQVAKRSAATPGGDPRTSIAGHARSSPIAADHPGGETENADANDVSNDANRAGKANGNAGNSAAGNPGAGTGSAQVRNTGSPDPAQANSATNANQASAVGDAAGGVGDASGGGKAGTAGSRTGAHAGSHAPVWESAQWQNITAQAEQGLRSGQIPPTYHDVVRRYFQRDE